jgi:hypothetical protein
MRMRSIASAVVVLFTLGAGTADAQLTANQLKITGIQLDNPSLVGGVLSATGGTVTGLLGGVPFTTDITNFSLQGFPNAAAGGTCSVLDLELAPIHISLLGLHVDTSPICLTITAIEGGGLLGDLLCGLTDGLPLLNLGNLSGFLGQLVNDLNTILGNQQAQQPPAGGGGTGDVCTGQCKVLDLVLGPLNLSLLGLVVNLDDCTGGPVEVCVSATRSEGLLGQLLCGLAGHGPLLGNLSLADVGQLVTLVNQLLPGGLTGAEIQQIVRLFNQLILV